LYKGFSDFKKGYQPRSNIVKDEKGDLVADCHSILTGWRNAFSLLLNVLEDNDIRQVEIHTAEPLVLQPSAFEIEMAIEKLKRHK
jgi:hypothetical protein